MVPLPPIKK